MTTNDTSFSRMSGTQPDERDWNAIEPQRSAMRALVATIDVELAKLDGPEPLARAATLTRLTATWAKLVAELALGPEPRLRGCPFCQLSIRSQATRCRYCLRPSAAAPASDALPRGAGDASR